MTVKNGYTFICRWCTVFTVVFLGNNKFGLLNCGGHAEGEHLTAPMFQSTETGQWMFSKEEIQKWLMKAGARQIPYKLSVVRGDYWRWVNA